MLLKLEGFQYALSLDLKMGYYHIQISKNSSNLCTIISSGGRYFYNCLPMGFSKSPDIFQQKKNYLFYVLVTGYRILCGTLEYIELRIQLNQFEIFVSSFIHERKLKTLLFQRIIALRENHVSREINIRNSQFSYTDAINMNLPVFVTPPYIYHGCSTRKKLWEEKFTPMNMKKCSRHNVR